MRLSNFTNNCWGGPDYASLVGGRLVMYITASNLKDWLPAHTHTHTMSWTGDDIIKLSKEQRALKFATINLTT